MPKFNKEGNKLEHIDNSSLKEVAPFIEELSSMIIVELRGYPEYQQPFFKILKSYMPRLILPGSGRVSASKEFATQLEELFSVIWNEPLKATRLKESCLNFSRMVLMGGNFRYVLRSQGYQIHWIDPVSRKKYKVALDRLVGVIIAKLKQCLAQASSVRPMLAHDSLLSLFESKNEMEIKRRLEADGGVLLEYTQEYNNLLHFAVLHGCVNLVPYLLEKGLDPLQPNCKGNTPLKLAFLLGDMVSIRDIITHVDYLPRIESGYVSEFPNAKICQYAVFCKQISFVYNQSTGNTGNLHLRLYDHDLNFVDEGGNNILHYIASYANSCEWSRISDLLLKDGGCTFFDALKSVNNKGYTPIMRAIKAKNTALVEFLCQNYTPELLVGNSLYVNPIELAEDTQEPDLIRIIKTHFNDEIYQSIPRSIPTIATQHSHAYPVISKCLAWWG